MNFLKKYKKFFFSIFTGLISGLILLFIEDYKDKAAYSLFLVPIVFLLASAVEHFSSISHISIIGFHKSLSNSNFKPKDCIEAVNSNLDFLGIYANKWFSDGSKRKDFLRFINKLKSEDGRIRFLLFDPNGEAIHDSPLKDDNTIHNSLHEIKKILRDKDNASTFEVRLYDEIPKFRIIILDEKTVVVSGYVEKKEHYHSNKHGWEWPLISFRIKEDKPIPLAFVIYFNELWKRSKPIKLDME